MKRNRGGLFGGTRRFLAITRVLAKFGVADLNARWFSRRAGNDAAAPTSGGAATLRIPSPGRLRAALEELGPSFIKLGQLMSTRADVFPPEYIEAFRKLQDSVPPFSFQQARELVERELKRPLDQVFADFETRPLGAASVAQVHRARLYSGEHVAVKIVRPGIERTIQEDIRLMYYFAAKLEKMFEVARLLGAVNLVAEFERTIFRELDMYIEAGSIEKFQGCFEGSDEIHIPRVHWDYTTRSILVMEHIEGVKMDDVAGIRAYGIEPREIAMVGLRSFSRQLMEFGYFHADPHPANTIVMPDGRVGLVDFGITGYIDDEMMRQIAHLFLGYAEHDYDMVMEALENAGLVNARHIDLQAFRRDLKDISEPFYGRALQTIAVREVYDQVIGLVLKHHIRMPRNLLLLLKTFVQAEALGKILNSDANILEVTRPYAEKLVQKGYDTRKILKNIGRETRNMGQYMRRVPQYLNDILRQAARGDYQLEFRHQGFEKFDKKIERGINRLTVGAIISASTIAAALILNSQKRVIEFQVDLLGLGPHRLAVTDLLGIAGYSIATILGIWLIFSIFRSGKL
ncbi:MAG: AarF/ABC1/UbiB kinase family protein [Desulfobacterales bacterium]|nr:AarF/ABC1/UbiB kinase family protein [Desulfobacterales bacterium]MDJ0854682.1 AarF/ABC1/UbiB kinase family protein [Desulfobacterales bacterium]MDJ0889403.1 AarF/ABC1/UbiB kinase family protein [Desulfobacterales bacterium]MDJ0989240.1 AarF/ABC1/UbiB kinase family protein [Desulfobacterales bacterium]